MAKKKSFFSRLVGNDDPYENYFDDPSATKAIFEGEGLERHAHIRPRSENSETEDDPSGELAVDVYQTPDAIVVKALIAGVQPNSIDISLTREILTISGSRQDEREVDEEHYFQRELYWGSFSRTVLLPEEVDVDGAEASERHGILMIRLPKVNKKKETKLKVRSR
ncbi:MAG: Protein containing Heat shock protein Hsp20 protein [Parcubacteria group bacterium GW2011_GWB1_50_9]|uniref:Protein containing Heat shock protein Hsp20 protein n=1 Tax=Candidatus Adlerbacteria bacterium GW2011_GWC1_50_9 TaxID=1618608 RepID=A0A0G1ZJM8_9BACT|nr:MAG: Protein containing Heat shock protein Hsp20 protein [Parcubacteria group bacterium GW2011_GWA2_49_16]KKW18013.1 MAG: Protein containing Heat shock protein Hsp20 protein [Parcubacteria group bacterium GW2011_GWB1_50_9]KKW19564.1 MAG: Protein containing Heat shock protein Hsp20 protein [Candidatus Adlerbacteria bacterium GW2011_GWC1_50_9]KKW32665.1 MAG: Protein containing Heat shock protein Hsp20 protein [Parcubacteria group bacterium GW2011_GWA1_53_13]